MDSREAKATLRSLLETVDSAARAAPAAPMALPQPSVSQALLFAIAAIDADEARRRRRAKLPRNTGRPWKPSEDEQVLAAFSSGEPLASIAADHQRSLASVESRLERLGVLAPEKRLTRNRYVTAGGRMLTQR